MNLLFMTLLALFFHENLKAFVVTADCARPNLKLYGEFDLQAHWPVVSTKRWENFNQLKNLERVCRFPCNLNIWSYIRFWIHIFEYFDKIKQILQVSIWSDNYSDCNWYVLPDNWYVDRRNNDRTRVHCAGMFPC